MSYHQSISVRFDYDVVFTRDVFAEENEALAGVFGNGRSRAVFFLDDGLVPHWPKLADSIEKWCSLHAESVQLAAPVQVVPGGERIKNSLDVLDRFGRLAADLGLDRHSYVVIVGGGAVLDAVGFAASTVHRGLRQVRVPTTVLSQADSGVGVKNGLNRFGIKNYYGAFAPPVAVVDDAAFLKTLSRRDWVSGVAEAFKVAIIKDREFLDFLAESAGRLSDRGPDAMERLVRRCATLHLDHIRGSGDPFEAGSARPLDFGHWAAHRLEDMTGYELRHGEAVAIGIALDMHCAVELGLVEAADREYVCAAMERCGLSLWHDALSRRSKGGTLEILRGLEQFREHLGGTLTLAMPRGLGDKTDINELPDELVEHAAAAMKERAKACAGKVRTSHTA